MMVLDYDSLCSEFYEFEATKAKALLKFSLQPHEHFIMDVEKQQPISLHIDKAVNKFSTLGLCQKQSSFCSPRSPGQESHTEH